MNEPAANLPRQLFRFLQLLTLVAVSALLTLLVWSFVEGKRGAALVNAIREGKRPVAPAFTLTVIWRNGSTWPTPLRHLLAGRTVQLRALRGYPVVVNFWASWCIPCKKEAPRLDAAAQRHAGSVVFLGVDVQDLTSDARTFLSYHQVRYPSLRDNGGQTYDGYGLTGVPETYWINPRGRIVAHYAGAISSAQLEAGIHMASQTR